jgi:hypothetical protein
MDTSLGRPRARSADAWNNLFLAACLRAPRAATRAAEQRDELAAPHDDNTLVTHNTVVCVREKGPAGPFVLG